ncbi:hypothetical protein T11_3297 [Trichinella zimbabwensis]|uniref:Peptidase aspartic putative domain-containing protein n=1 Tax=Trichinella zimbabwensis TaxID=268475 RepID=A0A0V1I8Q3_9BILA|nr:hypothetical protein T11_3297 [Trichinella zimbabwensis]
MFIISSGDVMEMAGIFMVLKAKEVKTQFVEILIKKLREVFAIHGLPRMHSRHCGALLRLVEGIDYYYEFVTGRIRIATSGSVAVETRLGWIVCGRTDPKQSSEARVFLMKGEDPDDTTLRKFW